MKKAAHATPNRLLRAARKERGWTQQQIADRIGAPLALNISRWESGTAFPSAYYLEKLCQLFGKSLSELGLSQVEEEASEEQASRTEPPPEQNQAGADPRAGQHTAATRACCTRLLRAYRQSEEATALEDHSS